MPPLDTVEEGGNTAADDLELVATLAGGGTALLETCAGREDDAGTTMMELDRTSTGTELVAMPGDDTGGTIEEAGGTTTEELAGGGTIEELAGGRTTELTGGSTTELTGGTTTELTGGRTTELIGGTMIEELDAAVDHALLHGPAELGTTITLDIAIELMAARDEDA